MTAKYPFHKMLSYKCTDIHLLSRGIDVQGWDFYNAWLKSYWTKTEKVYDANNDIDTDITKGKCDNSSSAALINKRLTMNMWNGMKYF